MRVDHFFIRYEIKNSTTNKRQNSTPFAYYPFLYINLPQYCAKVNNKTEYTFSTYGFSPPQCGSTSNDLGIKDFHLYFITNNGIPKSRHGNDR